MNDSSAATAAPPPVAAPPDQTQTDSQKAQALQTLTPGLYTSISKLGASSKPLPFDRDFHFYNNFNEFKAPIQEIARQSQSVLQSIGSSAGALGKSIVFPEDLDDAYDWLVNVNDELFERFDASVDEFQKLRKKEEESGKRIMDVDGFQMVYGKKKKNSAADAAASSAVSSGGEPSSVKIASLRDKKVTGPKPKIPFHIPSIRRPQDEHNILVNNSNQPFQHVWLQKSEDEERVIHPLENVSVLDFVDKNVGDIKPAKPPGLESTPFKFVTEVKDLKAMAAKLRQVDEFAVDLEHNQYRSFQGLTCLIQISTRTEDFVVDALKLRIHIGPYLREVFKDPSKKKVLHGADRDIIWLQRDFGIYICNLFDTGQASRVLKLDRNSLEHLLHHYCGVSANKEYQNADWRLRPLPEEMLRYAREDTHYLLYIYDLMRIELYSMSGQSDEALVEVYKRSSEICMQLYQKEVFTDSSYLHIYGLQDAGFNAQQLAIVAGLFEWRDTVARAEDESTGYILPNKTLLEIAKQIPVTTNKLQRIVKSKHAFIERYLGTVVSIIRHAMQNASAFEATVEQLKQARIEAVPEEIQLAMEGPEATNLDVSPKQPGDASPLNADDGIASPSLRKDDPILAQDDDAVSLGVIKGEKKSVFDRNSSVSVDEIPSSVQSREADANGSTQSSSNVNSGAAVQALKKPSRGFGALFGSTGPKKKIETENKEKEEKKLEQIRASVNLYFHNFAGKNEKLAEEETVLEKKPDPQPQEAVPTVPFNSSNTDVIILDDDDSDELDEEEEEESPSAPKNKSTEEETERISVSSGMETDNEEDEPMSLSDLSTSFQKCLDSVDKDEKTPDLKPFDYEAARKDIKFGEREARSKVGEEDDEDDGDGGRKGKKGGGGGGKKKKDGPSEGGEVSEFGQGRRRQAFPVTGNRSVTFR